MRRFASLLLLLFAAPAAWAQPFTTQVISVPSGDTLVIRRNLVETRVRLYGVDAPDVGQPLFEEALRFTESRALNRLLRFDVRGEAGSTLTAEASFLEGGGSLGAALVRAGLARWDERTAPLAADLAAAEQEARRAGRGLWATTAPVVPVAPVIPAPVAPAAAALRLRDPGESGLAHPWRVSVGYYEYGCQNDFRQTLLDLSDVSTDGFAVKVDYSFFRPTRHEAMVSVFYLAKPFREANDAFGVGLEYRWRFAQRGAAYYGINVNGLFIDSESFFVTGSALGIEFGKGQFVELRYLYEPDSQDDVSMLMVGTRF